MNKISRQKILHIVNDNVAAKKIKEADLPGEILPWQDALYEGPVVAYNDINELAKNRAKYFAARGIGDYKSIEKAYEARNERLKRYTEFSHIILWFDFDLFGQLQFIQLADWLSKRDTGKTELMAIDLQKIQRGRKILRIGQLLPTDIVTLFQSANEITSQQVDICCRAWSAFTSETPQHLLSFYPRDLSSMPFLKNAFARLLQEYPSRLTGLSRTEYLIIDAVKNKMTSDDAIFNYVQKKEPVAFMSQQIFQQHLDRLINAQYPILKKEKLNQEAELELSNIVHGKQEPVENNDSVIGVTSYTNQVLNKWVDWIQLNGINRWIGGVHLNDGCMWRYDPTNRQIHKTYV